MKRCLPLLLILCLLLGACSDRGEVTDYDTIEVYRVLKPDSQTNGELLRAESVPIEADADLLHAMLDALESSPADPLLVRSLPADVSIYSYVIDGTELILELSESYLELEGIQKTLTDYCITLSLCSLDGIGSVSIFVNGQPVSLGLESEDVLLFDSDESPYKKQLRLYFTDADGRTSGRRNCCCTVSKAEASIIC